MIVVLAADQAKDNIPLCFFFPCMVPQIGETKKYIDDLFFFFFHRIAGTLAILETLSNCMYKCIKLRIGKPELKHWNRSR